MIAISYMHLWKRRNYSELDRTFVFCVVFCRSLLVFLSLFHLASVFFVWSPLWYLRTQHTFSCHRQYGNIPSVFRVSLIIPDITQRILCIFWWRFYTKDALHILMTFLHKGYSAYSDDVFTQRMLCIFWWRFYTKDTLHILMTFLHKGCSA